MNVFGSKKSCFKCKVDREGNLYHDNNDWTCPKCYDIQFAKNKQCRKCHFVRIFTNSNNCNWECPKCKINIQEKHNVCFKCGVDKNGNTVIIQKPGDWNCPKCKIILFASRDKCFKCGTPKLETENNHPSGKSESVGNGNECSICLELPSNMLLLHEGKSEGHKCCCSDCALILISSGSNCPICRQKVTQAIRVYDS